MELFFAIIIALNSATVCPPAEGAEFFFKEHRHKFPDTKEGVLLEHDFVFRNEGTTPLIIKEYRVACSCTKVDFPKGPISPQQEGKIHLSFDTKGKYRFQSRKIQLFSNAGTKPETLSFKVNVVNN